MANFGFLLRCSSPSTEVDKNVSYVCKLTPEFIVGRAQSSALCIPDVTISRTHCVFSFDSQNQIWTVQDKSRTGTWVNSKRILPNTVTPLQISDLVCFGPTNKFQYTFRTYHTDGSSSSSSNSGGAGSSSVISNSSSVAGTSGSRLNQLAGSSSVGASLKFVVDPMAESESPHVAWSDGGPSSSLASSSRVSPCVNDQSLAGPSSGLKRAACSSDDMLSVKRTHTNDVRELSCQLEQLHMKECRLLKDMEEMLMSVQLKFHKNMALLREEQLKLAEKAEVQQRYRLVTELNIRENCNRALTGVRHRINQIHGQLKQKEFDELDEDDDLVSSTYNKCIMSQGELEEVVESLRDSERELQRRLELAEQERDGVLDCCDSRQVGNINPQRSNTAQPCSSEEGAAEKTDGQTSDATSQTKAQTRPKLKAKRKMKPKADDTEQVKKTLLQSIGNLMEEELQCSICNEVFLNAVTINCSHSFCRFCLNQWKQHRMECPMCRMPITGEYRSIAIDSFISSMMMKLGEEAQERYKEMCAERAAREAARASTSGSSRPANPSTSSGPPNPAGPPPSHSHGPHVSQVPVHTGRPWNNMYFLRRYGANNSGGNGNGNPPGPPPNISVPPPGSPDHRNSRSRRRHGRPAAISPSSSSASSTEDQSEVSAFSGYSTPSWPGQDYSNREYDEEDDGEYEPTAVVPGIPGRYYGGYGVCFFCRQRGHWSNGCPRRYRY